MLKPVGFLSEGLMFRKVEDFRKGTLYSAECDLADWDELCDELIY